MRTAVSRRSNMRRRRRIQIADDGAHGVVRGKYVRLGFSTEAQIVEQERTSFSNLAVVE